MSFNQHEEHNTDREAADAEFREELRIAGVGGDRRGAGRLGIIPEKSPANSDARPVTSIQLPIITTGCARSPSQSLGEDAQAETKETQRKRLRLTRSREKMDSNSARGFAPHPGNAGCGSAIHESSVDATDVDRSGRRDVLGRANASTPLPLDRSAADA